MWVPIVVRQLYELLYPVTLLNLLNPFSKDTEYQTLHQPPYKCTMQALFHRYKYLTTHNLYCSWFPSRRAGLVWHHYGTNRVDKHSKDQRQIGIIHFWHWTFHQFSLSTHTHPFNGPSPGLPGWAGTRNVKPIWILLKQETVSGSGISWVI